MKNIIKNTIGIIGVALMTFAIVISFKADDASANKSDLDKVYMTKGGGSTTVDAVATTTEGVTYKAAGASTTAPVKTDFADALSININMTASTSAGYLNYTFDVSNDNKACDTDPNTCDWFSPASLSGIAYGSTTPFYTWKPDGALNATSSLNIVLTNVTWKFVRPKISCTGSACALWMSINKKIQRN